MDQILSRADLIGGQDFVFSLQELTERLRNTQKIFVLIEPLGPWVRATINGGRVSDDEEPRLSLSVNVSKNMRDIFVNEFCVARPLFMADKLRLTKRVIAGPDVMDLDVGTIAEIPREENNNRYLILLDNGSAVYAAPDYVFPILGQTSEPWYDSEYHPKEENSVFNDYQKTYCDINKTYFLKYPHNDLLNVKIGQKVDIYRDGRTTRGTVTKIDCDIMELIYKDQCKETIHRGSHRIITINDNFNNLAPPLKPPLCLDQDLEYIADLYERASDILLSQGVVVRPTARKSTATRDGNSKDKQYQVCTIRGPDVPEYLSSISAEDDDIDHINDHKCTTECLRQDFKTELDYDNLVDEFRDVTDLKVPLMLGWKRYLRKTRKNKYSIVYEAPCGRVFANTVALKWCLYNIKSKMDMDYFCYDKNVILNRGDFDMRYLYREPNIAVDEETGLPAERKNVALMNIYSYQSIPHYYVYTTQVKPYKTLELIRFNIDKDFKSGCNCGADCMDRTNCPCHRLNETCAGSEAYNRGSLDPRFNYQGKRLSNQVPTGIFECNEFCACSSKCPNRVVQNGIRVRFQIQMTVNKGWGVYTLDDIPEGAFLSTYAGLLLDDGDQVGENDLYLADLDFITVNQRTKEIFSDDDEGVETNADNFDLERVFENARLEDEKELESRILRVKLESDAKIKQEFDARVKQEPDTQIKQESGIEAEQLRNGSEAGGVKPNTELIDLTLDDKEQAEASHARYPKRSRRKRPVKRDTDARAAQPKATTSRKPELRVDDGKFKNIHKLLGSRDYTIDSRFTGNLGRFYNHSCTPNAFVQSVFIDTHDLRFPVVAFFASRNIKAMEEITWNYNYKVDSIPNRVIVCNCGSLKCAGRIL